MSREVPASPKQRIMAFLDAFRKAPDDADIEIRVGHCAAESAILVSFQNTEHALLVSEARAIANIMEESMNAHPEDPEGLTLPNIIMGLRAGCDEAERSYRRT